MAVFLIERKPWGAHVDLLGRCATDAEREFYLRHALRENHSVRDLRRAIDTATFERVALADGKIATLSRVFPEESRRHLKDSYLVEFLGLPVAHSETDLRRALVHRLGQFLREQSRDFSFIGRQEPTGLGGRIDRPAIAPDASLVLIELKRNRTSGETQANVASTSKLQGEKEPWNGEYNVSFGGTVGHSREDARRYGFISGGGGSWYS